MLSNTRDSLHTVKDRVGYILENIPEARDSDKKLLRTYWTHFDWVSDMMSEEEFLGKTTAAESITRARRELQEQWLYHASEKVKEWRATNEKTYRDVFGGVRFVEAPNPW